MYIEKLLSMKVIFRNPSESPKIFDFRKKFLKKWKAHIA
jgi:hypothetical protein